MIGIVTKSRKEHLVAQTRELACTQELLPQVIGRGKFIIRTVVRIVGMGRMFHICNTKCSRL